MAEEVVKAAWLEFRNDEWMLTAEPESEQIFSAGWAAACRSLSADADRWFESGASLETIGRRLALALLNKGEK